MIRAILVDDEHIVRKGLLHILPWDKHGMEVMADFEGGEQALAWMEKEPVDLLVTDLSMPGLSGFDLMRVVKEKHPHTETAILTCHQDFQYVQDALRLGAIDYIVKTELDDEKLDRLFGRIAERLAAKEERPASTQPAAVPLGKTTSLLMPLAPDCKVQELYAQPALKDRPLDPLPGGVWFTEELAFEPGGEPAEKLKGRWAVFCLHHVQTRDRSRLKPLLETYVRRHSFYVLEHTESAAAIHDSMQEVLLWESKPSQPREDWVRMWRAFDWLYQDELWERLLDEIAEQRPEPNRLAETVHQSVWAWRSMLRWEERFALLEEAGSLQTWTDWKSWLQRVRRSVRGMLDQNIGIDKDIMTRIIQSIEWSLLHMDDGITQEEAAAEVHLSRGYFSDCFKRTTGATYNDYMRLLRMDQAKRLLAHSELAVQDIAARCGFADESYFRKLFRQETGKAPKVYRDEAAGPSDLKRWPPAAAR
ncbi:two-component system response regulator YesN [Paenibacillus taihuensis]|uniref:Two-component system response regulator YesN n=1 Tax=Paenibacillus taihuensis TaxID=1156355 RepID=A0A3D9Q3W3_9BACL|nr:response regulator [Paenibacillus taihuensis]REE57431.1 two-component system response regulator YesN [Paenibacillus taihuensis]